MSPHDDAKPDAEMNVMSPHEMHAHDQDGAPLQEGETVRAGEPLDRSKHVVATEEAVVEALKSVYDPEIPVNIYDLGLIYDLKIADNGNVDILMTLTAPACPVAGTLPKEVAEVAARVEGVGETAVTLTWDPPWTPANMSEVAKVALDMF
jgi:FeS assembly SUF system protein